MGNSRRILTKPKFGTRFGVISEQTECAICLQSLFPEYPEYSEYSQKNVILPYRCEHKFHEVCISNWNRGCPLCRENISRSDYLINELLKKYNITNVNVNDTLWIRDRTTNIYIKGKFVRLFYSDNKLYLRLRDVKTIFQNTVHLFNTFDLVMDLGIEFIRIIN